MAEAALAVRARSARDGTRARRRSENRLGMMDSWLREIGRSALRAVLLSNTLAQPSASTPRLRNSEESDRRQDPPDEGRASRFDRSANLSGLGAPGFRRR